jgi:hypothetical protein
MTTLSTSNEEDQPKMSELTSELTFLPDDASFIVNAFHDLTLEMAGETFENVTVERAFPLNAPNQFIIVKDNQKDEIGIIENVLRLPKATRNVLGDALDQTYYLPRITKIHKVETNFHIPKWTVDTDRGPRVFEIPSSRRDVRVIGGGRVLMRDADGNRYEIPDYRKLDAESMAFAETLI